MAFQDQPGVVTWRVRLASSPETVFEALTTDAGRCRHWCEQSVSEGDQVTLTIVGYPPFTETVRELRPPETFEMTYVGTVARFELAPGGRGGTDLTLRATEVSEEDHKEFVAGWVSLLLTLKAAVDYSIDLRNHDPTRCWETGYADN